MSRVVLVFCVLFLSLTVSFGAELDIPILAESVPSNYHHDTNDVRFAETTPSTPVATNTTKVVQQKPAVATPPPPPQSYSVPCDLAAERGICLFDGQKVIVPDAVPKGLIAHYTFDDVHALDYSRNQYHAASPVAAGPGRGGIGSSARFEDAQGLMVPQVNAFQSLASQFSLSFWLFLTPPTAPKAGQNADTFCPLVYLGEGGGPSVFSVTYNSVSRYLGVTLANNAVSIRSQARLLLKRWYHIAVRRATNKVELFINGVSDVQTSIPLTSLVKYTEYNLYAGRVPKWSDATCSSLSMLLDDLRVFNNYQPRHFIEADSFPSLGSVEPAFTRFGCRDCTFDQAVKSCPQRYHVCYLNELRAGALTVGRVLGYVEWNTLVWENDVTSNFAAHAGDANAKKTALCCSQM